MNDIALHIFRASLDAKRYRELEIESSSALYDLAEAVIDAFGFDFDHPFGFYSKLTGNIYRSPICYTLFADMGEDEDPGVRDTQIATVFSSARAKMALLFDYGDQWLFKVETIGRGSKQSGTKYPRVTKSVGEAPEQYPDPEAAEEDEE